MRPAHWEKLFEGVEQIFEQTAGVPDRAVLWKKQERDRGERRWRRAYGGNVCTLSLHGELVEQLVELVLQLGVHCL